MDEQARMSTVWLPGPHERLQGLNVHGRKESILWKQGTFEMIEFHKKPSEPSNHHVSE